MSDQCERLPFLLEIGSEEIPARFIPPSMQDIAGRLENLLRELHLAHGPLRVLATPRRLAVLCADLAARQPDRLEEVKGPPLSAAFDAEGKPTPAAQGFARKLGVAMSACERGRDQRGEYLLVRRRQPGRPAAAVLAEHLPQLVLSLPFRKTMRWGDLDLEYARPLQWLVCLLGGEVVPFGLGNLTSGRTTRGHRTLTGNAAREIAAGDHYEAVLRDLHVVGDPVMRRQLILAQAEALLAARPEPGDLQPDEELLSEVVHLCEHPTVLIGSFDPVFFELPDEVIATALKAHQRYFVARRAGDGRLLPCFIAVRDGGSDHLDSVRAGNERVLQARLQDALFYWRTDQRRRPDEHAAALAAVTWLEGFGSVADHTGRAARLAAHLWAHGMGEDRPVPAELKRAAALSRFDLVTEMIKDGKEFTKLEGLIAARYAAAAGEDQAVCQILVDSLLPRAAADELPQTAAGAVLSVAWRLDTLAGCWLAGFAPTGAKDPYALRRHALAMLRILLARRARVNLDDLLRLALAQLEAQVPSAVIKVASQQAHEQLLTFLRIRLEGWLIESTAADPDVVRAVLPVRAQDPAAAAAWIEALRGFRDRDEFLLLARSFKRITNILGGQILTAAQRDRSAERWLAGGGGAAGEDFAALADPAELALRDAVVKAVPDLLAAEERDDYLMVFRILNRIGPDVDRFFDTVRVNAQDAGLRGLRHGFLREIHALFCRYADFSQVVLPEEHGVE